MIELHAYILFFFYLFYYVYHWILTVVLCAVQQDLVYPFCPWKLTPANPSLRPHSSPTPYLPPVCSLCPWVCFCLMDRVICHILESTSQPYHMVSVFLWLTSLSMITSTCIHVAVNGVISFFLWLDSIPSCIRATSLSTLLMDIQVVSVSGCCV